MTGLDPIIDEAKPVGEREKTRIAGNIKACIDAGQKSNPVGGEGACIQKVAVSPDHGPGRED